MGTLAAALNGGPSGPRRAVGPQRYAIGLLALAVAGSIGLTFGLSASSGLGFLVLLGAVMVTAGFAGVGPGVATSLVAATASGFSWLPSAGASMPPHAAGTLFLFLVESTLLSILIGALRASRLTQSDQRARARSSLAEGPPVSETGAALPPEVAHLAAPAAIAVDCAHLAREAQVECAAAEAASRVKDEFLATLSHELRTPLTAILGWTYLLQRGQLGKDEIRTAIETIIRNATAQNQIIDELLDVSRSVAGKLQLGLQPVEIASIVTAAIGTVTPAANVKGVHLQLIHDPAGTSVMGDPERLQQIFWNLLSNAVKFTPRNGRVRVTIQSIGSGVEVSVADTGLGIDAVFLPHVFERFSQRDSSSTRTARGLGLGLAIARQLVELHGGSIDAESPGTGQGSTFTVKFPRSPVASAALNGCVDSQADRTVGLEDAPDLAGIRVLIVEDDADARALVAKVLEGQGASVSAVSCASEALEVLGRERVDVLLSDIERPGTDGFQLIRDLRLRPSQQGGSVPAAALTAYARMEDRLSALRAGFQAHLSKPVQPAELIAVVASLASHRT